jgi:hypothetical protein
MTLSLAERVEAFKAAFPKQPASWPWLTREDGRAVLYAVWVIGAAYGNESDLYGAYPRTYLKRVMAFYPDVAPSDILHPFSGSLPPGKYTRLDLNPARQPDVVGNVCAAPQLFPSGRFALAIADPPYSVEDAVHYGVPMVNRAKAITALAGVVRPRGHLVWLDQQWPMHSKREWVTVGRILLERSTMHRTRSVHLFERRAA